ncbi:DUF1559 domain-containing protein [Aeoliella sp.]|uniref:DUF1559 family PulG-like putative transporter n=1 Tax=Aeoliella sp. TaxID=2795800 RepID=UPI003CCC14BC
MTFRLVTLLYLFALLAASLAVFGVVGILVMVILLWFAELFGRFFDLRTDWPRVVGLAVVGGMLWLGVTSGVKHRSPTAMSRTQLRVVTLGLIKYEQAHGHFPPPYVEDDEGNPLYSWRVLILPYIDYQAVYDEFHLDEPWESPHNHALLDTVDIFSSPRHGRGAQTAYTDYLTVVGEGTVWDPTRNTSVSDVRDGAENTLLAVEAGGYDIFWSEPRDIPLDEGIRLLTGKAEARCEVLRSGYFASDLHGLASRNVSFVDGRVERFGPLAQREDALALLTLAGGEPGREVYDFASDGLSHSVVKTIVHWDHIWGVTVWLALVLLPIVPAARRIIWPPSGDTEGKEQEATEKAEGVLEH